jgi:hypothetical protein
MLKETRQVLAIGLSLVIATSSYGYQNAQPDSSSGGATDGAPMSASELDALVAPMALYPDALVAQIMAAATFPDQVAVAVYWLHENQQFGIVAHAGRRQTRGIPSVRKAHPISDSSQQSGKESQWTSSLEAYHNQSSEVMAAVQTLRVSPRLRQA